MARSADEIWSVASKSNVVIGVPSTGELCIRMPYSPANYDWLRLSQTKPRWDRRWKCWLVPRAWLNRLSKKAARTFGRCYVVQAYREMERCSPACLTASGVDCECSCLGEHHGCDSEGAWFEVSDAFACRWGARQYAVRLIVERGRVAPTDADLRAASGIRWQTYFVSAGHGMVKIGRSTDVESRLRSLQTANPDRLELLGTIDGDHEADLHRRFRDRHAGGEWFRLGEDDVVRLLSTFPEVN